jgi:TPR repeat protein
MELMACLDQEANDSCRWAAEIGDADAQFHLGLLYATGQGVPRDLVIAQKWLNLAAAAGVQEANAYRIRLAENMTATEIAEALRLARCWKSACVVVSGGDTCYVN